METKMLLQKDSLWLRLQEFSLDAPNVDFPFSKKLAKEEKWTVDFTKKAIEEYKKFVYLCCILPNGASPSEIVDKVWHLHLIYTQNYWEEFCPNILKRKLHHHPSIGGLKDRIKHNDWFTDTMRSYREVFCEDAPKDVWGNGKIKTIYQKNWFKRLKITSLFSVLLILCSCLGEIVSTLISIGISFGTAIVFGSIMSLFKGDNNDKNNDDGGGSSGCSGGSGCGGGGGCGGGCGGCGGCGG